jgi:hypothetical protein
MSEAKLSAIQVFRGIPKFRCTEPEFVHLKPSPESVIMQAKQSLEKCIDDVIYEVRNQNRSNIIKEQISGALSKVEKRILDTEEREYVAFYFHRLGGLTGVNVSFIVNRWLYGLPLAFITLILKKG